jgi:hypothetical protein
MAFQRIKLPEYPLYRLAAELIMERETVNRRAAKYGIDLKNLFLRDIVTITKGDSKESELARKIKSEADLNEQKLRENDGRLVERVQVETDLWDSLLNFKNDLFKLAKKFKCEKELDKLLADHWKK